MIVAPRIRRWMHRLRLTPFHPQWFAYLHERDRLAEAARLAEGRILDVGCANKVLRSWLSGTHEYIGLDMPRDGGAYYRGRPEVWADAHCLPFAPASFDTVVVMEVLEHLAEPAAALREIKRVLRRDGRVIITVPFLYPVHDAPWDFRRWTGYGLEHIAAETGFEVAALHPRGTPLQTGALLFNLGMVWQALHAPLPLRLLLIPVAILLVPLVNIAGALLSFIGQHRSPDKHHMAHGYFLVLKAG